VPCRAELDHEMLEAGEIESDLVDENVRAGNWRRVA
jgi:hypothetical protein